VSTLDIHRPDTGGQTVGAVIGSPDHFGLIVETGDRKDRAEDFFAPDFHVGGDVGEDRRFDEHAATDGLGGPGRAAAQAAGAGLLCALDEAQNLVELHPVGDRPDLRFGLHRITEAQPAQSRDETRNEVVGNRRLQEKP